MIEPRPPKPKPLPKDPEERRRLAQRHRRWAYMLFAAAGLVFLGLAVFWNNLAGPPVMGGFIGFITPGLRCGVFFTGVFLAMLGYLRLQEARRLEP